MISSTAKVAIPAASPDRRISGRPTRNAKTPPTAAASSERGDVADRVVAQQREEVGQHAGLRLERHGHHARCERADRDEADLAEREHARAADEDVDRDDDRDGDERVQEVDLVRARDEGRADPDERRPARPGRAARPARRAALIRGRPPSARPRANSPAGRSSSTTITSANTAEGRKTVLSVGSAPLITPLAKPIAKPPSVAVQSRSIPPTTTPTSTTIVSLSAKSGVTSGNCTVRITATVGGEHAREQHGDADHRCRPGRRAAARCGSRPRRRACAGRSSSARAGARAAPSVDRPRRRPRGSSPCARPRPPIVTAWFSDASETAGSPIVPSRMSTSSATLWSRNATAKVVTSITAGDCVRSGRKTAPLHRERERDHDGEAGRDARRRPASPT